MQALCSSLPLIGFFVLVNFLLLHIATFEVVLPSLHTFCQKGFFIQKLFNLSIRLVPWEVFFFGLILVAIDHCVQSYPHLITQALRFSTFLRSFLHFSSQFSIATHCTLLCSIHHLAMHSKAFITYCTCA